MRTLIIPCAGRKTIGGIPTYLKYHPDGTLLVRKAANCLALNEFDRIMIPILKEDNEFGAESKIEDAFSDLSNCKVVVLPTLTRDAPETIAQVIRNENISGQIIVKDANNLIMIPKLNHHNFIAGLNLYEWGRDIHNLHRMCFVSLNDKNQVLDIIEKQICSENIGVGLYGFDDAQDFLLAYDRLRDKHYPINKLFISHIVSYLIGYQGRVFHYIQATDFEDWGDEKAWLDIENRYATYFLDLDSLFGDNLDLGKEDIITALQKLSQRGACFVGFTSCGEDVKQNIKQTFASTGIHCLQIVYGCSKSIKKILLTNKETVFENMYTVE